MNLIIYINGKRVTKEEIKGFEIKNKDIKKLFAEKLTKKSN